MATDPFPTLPEDAAGAMRDADGADAAAGDAGGVLARTNTLIDRFLAAQKARAAADAAEIRVLADAARVIAEQQHTARAGSAVLSSAATELPYRVMVAELAAASRVSERTIQIRLDDADDLCTRFPATINALQAGVISRGHVSVIHDAGGPIDDDQARAVFEATCLERARVLSPGRLRPTAQVLAARLNPRTITERHTEAAKTRDVWVRDLSDGMAELIATLPATLAHAIHDRLTRHARTVTTAARTDAVTRAAATRAAASHDAATTDDPHAANTGDDRPNDDGTDTEDDTMCGHDAPDGPCAADVSDIADVSDVSDTITGLGTTENLSTTDPDTRTLGQIRADILTDTLLTATPQHCTAGNGLDAITAIIQITLPVLTATGHSEEPALLSGYGPIDTPTAVRLAGNAPAWERVMTSPVTGQVLATDRYRPHPHLKRFLQARDEHCRFPGCRMPVWRCDIDHNHEHAHGGTTCEQNLAHLCRHHHVLKTETPWDVKNLGGGNLLWTSPTGRTYADIPDPVLRFTPHTPDDADADADDNADTDTDTDTDEPPWSTTT